jgi:hypothetical protein
LVSRWPAVGRGVIASNSGHMCCGAATVSG